MLGIDAAWTTVQPSGVAFVVEAETGWRLMTVQPSYSQFVAAANGEVMPKRPMGSAPDVDQLLGACERLHPKGVDLVAIDMPLSTERITSRRTCDNLIARVYGGRHCSTHSPNMIRPGAISDNLRAGFERAGYPLLVSSPVRHGLIEVYPHPALLELTGAAMRLPYKARKTHMYWPGLSATERKANLFQQWRVIVSALELEISGVATIIGDPSTDANSLNLKAYEDRLDAVICAWVGIRVLSDSANAFGDEASAIWIPKSF